MFQLNSDSMPCPETDAWLLGTSTVRRFFPERGALWHEAEKVMATAYGTTGDTHGRGHGIRR